MSLPKNLVEICEAISNEFVQEGITNSSGGASCGLLCEELSLIFSCDMTYGSIYSQAGQLIDEDHAWLIFNGTIVDPTITQFSQINEYPGVDHIAIIPPNHPMQVQYDDR